PYGARVSYPWGVAVAKRGRLPAAIDRFRRVRAIDPGHAGGCQGLAHALREQGKAADALPYALRAAQLTRFQNADILVTLAETYADAGRRADAEKTATQALNAADPGAVPEVSARLEEMRARLKSQAR